MTSFSLLGQAVWICIEEKQLIDQSIQLGSVAGPVIQATGRLELRWLEVYWFLQHKWTCLEHVRCGSNWWFGDHKSSYVWPNQAQQTTQFFYDGCDPVRMRKVAWNPKQTLRLENQNNSVKSVDTLQVDEIPSKFRTSTLEALENRKIIQTSMKPCRTSSILRRLWFQRVQLMSQDANLGDTPSSSSGNSIEANASAEAEYFLNFGVNSRLVRLCSKIIEKKPRIFILFFSILCNFHNFQFCLIFNFFPILDYFQFFQFPIFSNFPNFNYTSYPTFIIQLFHSVFLENQSRTRRLIHFSRQIELCHVRCNAL